MGRAAAGRGVFLRPDRAGRRRRESGRDIPNSGRSPFSSSLWDWYLLAPTATNSVGPFSFFFFCYVSRWRPSPSLQYTFACTERLFCFVAVDSSVLLICPCCLLYVRERVLRVLCSVVSICHPVSGVYFELRRDPTAEDTELFFFSFLASCDLYLSLFFG